MTLPWLCRLAGSPSSLQRPFHVVKVIAAHGQKLAVRVLRSDGRPLPRKTRFLAAGPAQRDGIGYPQGLNEGVTPSMRATTPVSCPSTRSSAI